MPPEVKIYSTQSCPYCEMSKRFFASKNIPFENIDVTGQPDFRDMLQKLCGKQTVPQIFIGDKHVGGWDELQALDANGELDALLEG